MRQSRFAAGHSVGRRIDLLARRGHHAGFRTKQAASRVRRRPCHRQREAVRPWWLPRLGDRPNRRSAREEIVLNPQRTVRQFSARGLPTVAPRSGFLALKELHLLEPFFGLLLAFVRSAQILALLGRNLVAVLYFLDHYFTSRPVSSRD